MVSSTVQFKIIKIITVYSGLSYVVDVTETLTSTKEQYKFRATLLFLILVTM